MFCVSVKEREWRRRQAEESQFFFCCGVYEMLKSQRWVDDKQCCPKGIKIYISQVTPIGNKQPDCSLCHSHTRSCLSFTRIHTSTHTCNRHTLTNIATYRPGVAKLQQSVSCLFNIPVSRSPSLISSCARACELTGCWITAFTYHTYQHGTQNC